MFERLAALPADAWNWDDRRSGPSLKDGKARVPGAVIGGLSQWTTLKDGTVEAAKAEADDALAQTRGTGLILGTGCVLPPGHSDTTLIGLIKAIGGTVKIGLVKPR
jgi:uroporphyrinogen decarboxylase